MNFTEAQHTHVTMMRAILTGMADTPLVLKGGTALLLCYGLDRFSEDLDFDAPKKLNLESKIENSLRLHCQEFRITRTKDTDTVQRYRIEYAAGSLQGRLKVEVSCRDKIVAADVIKRDGIRTYAVSRLIAQKLNALEGRTAARDLYDLSYFCRCFRREFSPLAEQRLRAALADLNTLEARFRPAFEDDDLFRTRANMLPALLLEMQDALK
jgi:predicted nucleotidyltransferase component of viral defense system